MQEPWSKWVKMQQQLMAAVKGAQSVPKPPSNRVPIGVRGGIVRVSVPVFKGPSIKVIVRMVMQPGTTKPRPEGEMTKTRFSAIIAKGGGHMHHEYLSIKDLRSLNSQRGRHSRTSPSIWAEHGACASAVAGPQPIAIISKPPPSSPNTDVELIGRFNEANIFIGNIGVTALIDMGNRFLQLLGISVNSTGMKSIL